jgi:GNAT superfamily N-acetyltransferase
LKVATPEDWGDVKDMVTKFIESTAYAHLSDEWVLNNLITNYLENPGSSHVCIIEPGKGFLAGMATPFPFGDYSLATELAWWVNPEERGSGLGLKLLEAFEYWAEEKAGCSLVSMSSLDDKVGEMYTKQGYKLYERAYMKVL